MVAAEQAVDLVIQDQFFGQVGPQGRVAFVVFEDQGDLGAAHAFNTGIFRHVHADVGHDIIGDFGRQFGSGPQFTAGCGRSAGERVENADFDLLLGPGAAGQQKRRDDEQHDAQ